MVQLLCKIIRFMAISILFLRYFKKVEMEKDHLNSFINAFLKYPGKSIVPCMDTKNFMSIRHYSWRRIQCEVTITTMISVKDTLVNINTHQCKLVTYLNMLLIWGGQIASIILCIAEASNEDCPKRIDFLDLWAGTDRFEGYVKRVVELYRRALEFVEEEVFLTAYLFD